MDAFKFARLMISFLVLFISVFVAYIFFTSARGGDASISEIITAAKSEIGLGSVGNCEPVIGSCEVEVKKEDQICSPDKLILDVKTELKDPISNQKCVEAIDKMKKQCAQGCGLVSESIITVPGEVTFQLFYIDPKTNNQVMLLPGSKVPESSCTAIGKRVVNLKADCG